jgi:UDP-N-acetylmuramoylalanine--D-glutamate ligase
MDWSGRNVVVLGLGDTGLSMTRWLARRGARVRVADTRAAPPHAALLARDFPHVQITTGGFATDLFAAADAIAISPGIDRREPVIADEIARGVPVMGDVEIFARAIGEERTAGAPEARVVAITGSNGKSTVTAMTGEIARACGRRTIVAGNIGLPVLDALSEIEETGLMPEVFVLELSSFQLESTSSLDADAATVLNVTEDHLDRYESMADYAAAKARVFEGSGVQVVNRLDTWSAGMARPGRCVTTFGLDTPPSARDWGISAGAMLVRGEQALVRATELGVSGLHNAANALAALALGDAVGLPTDSLVDGLRAFRGLPHRLQKIATVRGVTFYDDSKGTNVGATVAALNGLSDPVVLIAGGDGKGQDFRPLRPAVAARARVVVLFGRDAPQIEAALAGSGATLKSARTLEDAVELAYGSSRAGDAVLLSPACASYDMFRSYVHRAEVFVAAVHALAAREEGAR